MTPSASIETFIKSYEQCHLKAYLPTSNDVPTIGWGSTGRDIYLGLTWTQAQADQRFDSDLRRFALGVALAIGVAKTTQAQFDAMVSLAYNIGMGAFAKSTVLRKHKSADYVGAAMAFLMWNKQSGQVVNGLTRRRQGEQRIYKGLEYE